MKGNLMRVFPVLYVEAEKIRLKPVSFLFSAFMVKNSGKRKMHM